MKHIGRMKNNSARVVIVYRTLPGDPHNALVVGTQGLVDFLHDSLISVLESDSGQQANELADIIAVRKFPDGNNMLEYLHNHGHLKKVATNMVIVMPNTTTQIPLDELNKLIAQQKGIALEDLAIVPEGEVTPEVVAEVPAEYKNKWDKARAEKAAKLEAEQAAKRPSASVTNEVETVAVPEASTPEEQAKLYRSQADKLAKQAAEMRRKAEELVPTTKKKANAEA